MNNLLFKIIFTIKAIFVTPSVVFKKIDSGEISTEVYWIFSASVFVSFLKTLHLGRYSINFFETGTDDLLSYLSAPHVAWFLNYVFYFLFICSVFLFFRLLFKKLKIKPLFLSLMSISGIGVIFQILLFPVEQFIPANIITLIGYAVFLWTIILSLLAIKISLDTTYPKTIIIFFILALPIIFVVGLTGIAPYLSCLVV